MMLPEQAERPMDYRERHIVVTGGTGALGSAVVQALVTAGAVCHIPYIDAAEAGRFAFRDHANVKLIAETDSCTVLVAACF